jgi:hypothetical protein
MILASHGIVGSQITQFVGLLDVYSGAAAAYSLRLLRSAYTGSAIKVRRASDNTEQDIGFVNNELDTSALTTFCSGTDGFVTTWYDQSGNSRDATQTTLISQPQIVSSGSVITQGGKAAVYTTISGSKNLNTGLLTLPVSGDIDLDFFAVINNQSTGIANHLFGLNDDNISANDRRKIFCYGNDSATTISVRLFGGNIVYSNTTTGQLLFNTNYQGGGGAFDSRINGSSLSVSSFTNTGLNVQTSSGFQLMTGNAGSGTILASTNANSIGYLQEVIFYLSNQSSNRSGIEDNINDFYSIYP